jgi:hypothetical protein
MGVDNKQENDMDLTSMIIDYENGNLDEEQVLDLFQNLVNTGLAWSLQGSYGRQAMAFIQAGLIERGQ